MNQVSLTFDAGWTVTVKRTSEGYVELDWLRTGSWDTHLTEMLPQEAQSFAKALIGFQNITDEGLK